MKFSLIFGLLIYWSVIITAPVINKKNNTNQDLNMIKSVKKPINSNI